MNEMLYTFLGDSAAAWVCAGCTIESPLACHWLLRQSAAETFAQEFWKVEPVHGYPSKVCSRPRSSCLLSSMG
jgi:hypothetical protein